MTSIVPSNPFDFVGREVAGEDFVGRENELLTLHHAISSPNAGRCIALRGLPRIGKSSLISYAISRDENELWSKNIIPVSVNIAKCDNAGTFYRRLVAETFDILTDTKPNEISDRLRNRALVTAQETSPSEISFCAENFFRELKRLRWRVILVIDEFDAAPRVFKNAPSDFQVIRGLASETKFGVTLVLISRRPIFEIEQRVDGTSNLSGVMDQWSLPFFSESEAELLLAKINDIGPELNDGLKRTCHNISGGHPYLLGVIGRAIVDQQQLGHAVSSINIVGWRGIANTFNDYYREIFEWLTDIDMYDKLAEILFGPQIAASQADADFFLSYGLIRESENKDYIPFSDHFRIFLLQQERSAPLLSLWLDTERTVRAAIADTYIDFFKTDDWITAIEANKPKLVETIELLKDGQKKETMLYGDKASNELLDFSAWPHLWRFIECDWRLFESKLGQSKSIWANRFEAIRKVRNPLAHGRIPCDDAERIQVEGYCRELLSRLKRP